MCIQEDILELEVSVYDLLAVDVVYLRDTTREREKDRQTDIQIYAKTSLNSYIHILIE